MYLGTCTSSIYLNAFLNIKGYGNGSKYVYLVESGIFAFCGNAGVQYRRKNKTTHTIKGF